jgi:hypothetical protein
MRQYGYHALLMFMRAVRIVAIAAGLAVAASACSRSEPAPPVATVSVTLSKSSVALGGVLDLTYKFKVEPNAKISGDYVVFTHLNREDGTTIWNDDHQLPEGSKTSQWKPGQTIEYTRTRFVPNLSYLGQATIEVGLYRDDERLTLIGPNPADRESAVQSYRVAGIDLLPRSENIQTYRLSGWHNTEFAPDDATVEWQWTQKTAVLSLKNPKHDVTFFIEYDGRSDWLDKPQNVDVFCGDAKVGSFVAGARQPTLVRIPVSASQLGNGEMTQFRIEVDRTLVPAKLPNAGSDTRELGIRVFHAHIEQRGSGPS